MDGFAFLFRIPNSATRNRVINQRLWQIEGQTLFVAKWEPGLVPSKPELTSAPIWLELRDVPFQFFNEDGLEQIASLVGDPQMLHHSTATKTNLEVAKVLTIIDLRIPLPEAVNVQFESGLISRVRVSSPWMPPVCSHCREIGHTLKRCKNAPITCKDCGSTTHIGFDCPRKKRTGGTISPVNASNRASEVTVTASLSSEAHTEKTSAVSTRPDNQLVMSSPVPLDKGKGKWVQKLRKDSSRPGASGNEPITAGDSTEVDPDSSDISSSDSDDKQYMEDLDSGFTRVSLKRRQRLKRGGSLRIG